MESLRHPAPIDLMYLGRPDSIAACALETDAGLAIVDPGPACSLDALFAGLDAAGLDPDSIRFLILTHIHLDHAGATGTLVRRIPELRVFVHERGAVHLARPSRLLDSALRIYGDRLDRLFGEFLAVPEHAIVPLHGGETIEPGGRPLRIAYSPGHASHHIACLDESTGTVFLGDTAGERFAPSTHVLPVTPPPDIDLEAWHDSISRVRAWKADSLFITHFGEFQDVDRHLGALEEGLEDWSVRVRASLAEPGTDDERAARFVAAVRHRIGEALGAEAAAPYLSGDSIRDSWFGLARYWRKRT